MLLSATTIIATLVGLTSAAVFPRNHGSGFVTLPQSKIDKYSTYAYYAAAATCPSQAISNWECGTNCQENSEFQVAVSGGDGNKAPNFYVGYDSYSQTIIVGHQGTSKAKFFSNLSNSPSNFASLDPNIFPNIPSVIQVHNEFANDQSQTAGVVFQAVTNLLNEYSSASVTVVGYSLGGAVALLDGVFLRMQLPQQIKIKVITFGMPRVGNRNFATFVDQILPGGVVHINNMMDPVPVVPSTQNGYVHCSGEIHIQEATKQWIACPGQDNPDPRCIVGTVTSLNSASLLDNVGPYNNIMMRC